MKITNTHVTINVSNMEASIAFYESIGFALDERWENHYAQMSAKGIEIGLHPATTLSSTSNLSIGLTVDNFDTAAEDLILLGINITERNDEGGNFIHFTDLDGNPLYVIKPKW